MLRKKVVSLLVSLNEHFPNIIYMLIIPSRAQLALMLYPQAVGPGWVSPISNLKCPSWILNFYLYFFFFLPFPLH